MACEEGDFLPYGLVLLDDDCDTVIKPRKEDGHGSTALMPSYVTSVDSIGTPIDPATEQKQDEQLTQEAQIFDAGTATPTDWSIADWLKRVRDAVISNTSSLQASLASQLTALNNIFTRLGDGSQKTEITNLPSVVAAPWTRSGPFLADDPADYSATIDWLDPANKPYEQGYFSTVATSASVIDLNIEVQASNDPAFPADKTHIGLVYNQIQATRQFPFENYGYRYTRIKYDPPVNDLTALETASFFTPDLARSTPTQIGKKLNPDSHVDWVVKAELAGFNAVQEQANPIGLSRRNELLVHDDGVAQTPNNSMFVQGAKDYVEYNFGAGTASEAISRLRDFSTNGTVTEDSAEGQVVFSTGATPNSTAIFLTKELVVYNPAQGIIFEQSKELPIRPVGDQRIEWGFIADETLLNGTGYGEDVGGLYAWRKKNGVYEYKRYQPSFNVDQCLGGPNSRFIAGGGPIPLPLEKNNIFWGYNQWFGTAPFVKGTESPNKARIITDIEEYTGQNTGSSLPSGSMYLFVALFNGEAGGDLVARSGCWHGAAYTSKSDTTVLEILDTVLETPMSSKKERVVTVGTTAVRLDPTPLANRVSIEIANEGNGFANAQISSEPTLVYGDGKTLYSNTADAGGDVMSARTGPGIPYYAIAEDTVGTQTDLVRTAGSAPTGTATNPGNMQTDNSVDATFSNAGEYADFTNFTAGTTNTIVAVQLGVKAKKAASPATETVAQVGSDYTGDTTTNILPTDAAVPAVANALYVARIAMRDTAQSVNTVAGLNLTWLPAGAPAEGADSKVYQYYAYGSPGAAGVVTATLSAATNAIISVGVFTGADPDNPIEAYANPNGSSDNYGGNIAGTALGLTLVAAGCTNKTHTPGSGATETTERAIGTGANTCSLAATREAHVSTGSQSYAGTFSASVGWAVAVLTVRPADTFDTVYDVTYSYDGSPGATSGQLSFGETTYETKLVDVTADRGWVPADIALLDMRAQLFSKGAANGEADVGFVQVTDSTGSVARLYVTELGADADG